MSGSSIYSGWSLIMDQVDPCCNHVFHHYRPIEVYDASTTGGSFPPVVEHLFHTPAGNKRRKIMTAISTRSHDRFMELVSKQTDGIMTDKEMQHNIVLIQQLHDQYQENLFHLRRLVTEYATVQRRLRVELRKQGTVRLKRAVPG